MQLQIAHELTKWPLSDAKRRSSMLLNCTLRTGRNLIERCFKRLSLCFSVYFRLLWTQQMRSGRLVTFKQPFLKATYCLEVCHMKEKKKKSTYWYIDQPIYFMIENTSSLSLTVQMSAATVKSIANFHRITLVEPFRVWDWRKWALLSCQTLKVSRLPHHKSSRMQKCVRIEKLLKQRVSVVWCSAVLMRVSKGWHKIVNEIGWIGLTVNVNFAPRKVWVTCSLSPWVSVKASLKHCCNFLPWTCWKWDL